MYATSDIFIQETIEYGCILDVPVISTSIIPQLSLIVNNSNIVATIVDIHSEAAIVDALLTFMADTSCTIDTP